MPPSKALEVATFFLHLGRPLHQITGMWYIALTPNVSSIPTKFWYWNNDIDSHFQSVDIERNMINVCTEFIWPNMKIF